MTEGPILIDLEDNELSPAEAPPVPEIGDAALPAVAQHLAKSGGRMSRLGRWFFASLAALVSGLVGIAMWDFVTGLLATRPTIGLVITALTALVLALLLLVALREALAYRRLGVLENLQSSISDARLGGRDDGTKAAQNVMALYRGREELTWKINRVNERMPDQLDAESVLVLVETEVMDPLDKAALAEVESASRRVAMTTALVPIALADIGIALATNMRMVRAVAQIYGGRSGTVGSWRLVRAVLTHLVATGAVAIGDDLIGSVAGGAIAGKISRRFGEGIINGALTARVGITAITLCRPMPFVVREKPKTRNVVKRALTGVFQRG
ncbi:MAG: YcjF family protein [Paracoccaceae bacterium]|nr:YcjF family protein [Paracoccaceae bacterium]MDG2260188.1 YcjF family protein [Paracoccaceae bacterium]